MSRALWYVFKYPVYEPCKLKVVSTVGSFSNRYLGTLSFSEGRPLFRIVCIICASCFCFIIMRSSDNYPWLLLRVSVC